MSCWRWFSKMVAFVEWFSMMLIVIPCLSGKLAVVAPGADRVRLNLAQRCHARFDHMIYKSSDNRLKSFEGRISL